MLLPAPHVRVVPLILITLYAAGAFWLDVHGVTSPLPSSNPYSAPLPATITFAVIVLSGAMSYFLNELTTQRQELKNLVTPLEQRVSERTTALQRTNE